ncbi:MAG: hypothetical protein U0R70_13625 [Solirubrobacteraceae bacterium]
MDTRSTSPEITRRRLLELGAAAVAAGVAGPVLDPLAAFGAPARWPAARLGPAAARTVDARQFLSASQLLAWQRELDAIGLRATGTPEHERYVDRLHDRLGRAGVSHVGFEPVPLRRWSVRPGSWSLTVLDGSAAGPARTASYVPYSGTTPARGVSGELVPYDPASPPPAGALRGKIALFDVPPASVPYGTFTAVGYRTYDPEGVFDPKATYARPWLGQQPVIDALEALGAAGAAGLVAVLDLPADAAHGSYYPYDGVIRRVPALYVDRTVGARLKQAAAAGQRVRLTLPAAVKRVTTRNLVGIIPGASSELMLLHSHTDGPNAIEDNGPDAIVAMSQYLARLPRGSLPRSILVLLTSGHFAGGAGVNAWIARHRGGTIRRTAGAVTIEHLGAREWLPQPSGRTKLTGQPEPGTFFCPESSPLVSASYRSLTRAKAAPGSVLKPYLPDPKSPDGGTWPAEGEALWARAGIPTTNYITGPTYLLNWGIPTVDKLDVARMRAEAVSFTQLLLELSRVPRTRLRRLDLR